MVIRRYVYNVNPLLYNGHQEMVSTQQVTILPIPTLTCTLTQTHTHTPGPAISIVMMLFHPRTDWHTHAHTHPLTHTHTLTHSLTYLHVKMLVVDINLPTTGAAVTDEETFKDLSKWWDMTGNCIRYEYVWLSLPPPCPQVLSITVQCWSCD